ncbi:FadR family transcriptional regulator [Herbiconiux sp. CPCC 205763]|uniref:FadR family transcriptional regulator n=1 Tax=Herbiconiux aconitum TaxID=2970913 RepID=A0ABT2GNG7_9MICO|nr:FadR/GntR family transcriptional regulator [Herbiconiux aconitum]MCS5717696.1 FadR family transcriptional regulator [Herbiconiux aconitum]
MTSAELPSRDEAPARRSLTENVVSAIMQMVSNGELLAGQRLPIEKELSVRLGVSRGSLREGVRALAVMGVLETRQGDGTYVTSLDATSLLSGFSFYADLQVADDATQLLHVRRILESESAALAARTLTDEQLDLLSAVLDRVDTIIEKGVDDDDLAEVIAADSEFHTRIARSTGNRPLAALIESLASRTQRTRMWRAMTERGTVPGAQAEHRAILAELRRRDPDRARVRMETHLMGVEDFSETHPTEASEESDASSQ